MSDDDDDIYTFITYYVSVRQDTKQFCNIYTLFVWYAICKHVFTPLHLKNYILAKYIVSLNAVKSAYCVVITTRVMQLDVSVCFKGNMGLCDTDRIFFNSSTLRWTFISL